MDDKLSKRLEEIVLGVESKLWLNEQNELGLVYAQADLRPVLSHVRSRYSGLIARARISALSEITKIIEPLYKITALAQFKNVRRLNYTDYASMNSVKDVLLLFVVEETINSEAVVACNIIADVLCDIDNTRPNFKNSLSYKYLRLFLLLTIVGDFVSAACIAMFILTQLGE